MYRSCLCQLTAVFVALALVLGPSLASAQAPKAKPKGKDAPAEPEEVKLDTKDGWSINATYFPGKLKKEAVPFILLHGWKGQRGDMDPLAKFLQSQGHGVIAPDLRGHGQSNTRPGSDKTIDDPDDLKRLELENTWQDIEACKKFMRLKNNAGEVNLESLCVVASDFSCILAMQWAAYDWSATILPSYKNGQDVKALVLLTPWQTHKGITMQKTLQHPAIRTKLSMLLIAGTDDSRGFSDAKKLNTSLEAFRPDMKKPDVEAQDRTLVFMQPETNLDGAKLLNPALKMMPVIGTFVKFRLVDRKEDFPWQERISPND
ncbi:MAG: alpha/beta hydrolase [Planctomycetaceae bacterium]|nr:alpha/beta hydrolase [Planctomycetaceae bacterium]